jgi:hypothetical protein
MERQNTIVRAARYVLGAGTLAAAMLALTAGQASAQSGGCFGEAPTVCGHVFTEGEMGDNFFQVPEGTDEVTVVVTNATGTEVASQLPGDCVDPDQLGCGYYEFNLPEPGNYNVCIVVLGQNEDCRPIVGGVTGQIEDFEAPSGEEPPSDVWGVGTGTPGYWKNHPEAWPAAGVTVGGVLYQGPTITTAIKLMGKVGGDKTVSMFAALISAKLNTTLANNTACILQTIEKADLWMTAHPVGSGVKASSPAWAEADAWHTLLDDYNNGKLCAPHRS